MRTKFLMPILALAAAIGATACLPASSPAALASPPGAIYAINADRDANGVGALAEDGQLDLVAQNWANQLAASGQLGHQNLNGVAVAENVFLGPAFTTNGLVESSWMGSPIHHGIILDPGLTRVGVGVAHDGAGNTFVVADFG